MRRFSIKQGILVAAAVVVAALGLSAPVFATSLVQASENLSSVPASKVIDGAAFMAGDTVTVDGTINGDLFCAGNSLTVNGTINGDVICAGNSVTIAGTVKGDIRVAGNTINLRGTVKGSASVAGNTVVADSSFRLGSDLTVGANSMTLGGFVGRDVRAGVNTFSLSGAVGRNIDGSLESLTIASTAKVAGNVTYMSETDGSIAKGTVLGTVQREAPQASQNMVSTARSPFVALMAFLFFVTLLFVIFALFIALVMPRYIRSVAAPYTTGKDFLKAAAAGVAAFFVVLPIVIMAFLTGVGALVGIFILVAYALAGLLSGVVAAYRLGVFMVNGRTTNLFAIVALGSVTLAVLVVLPFIGFLVAIAAGSIGLGMVLLSLTSQYEGRPYSGVQGVVVKAPVKPQSSRAKNSKK